MDVFLLIQFAAWFVFLVLPVGALLTALVLRSSRPRVAAVLSALAGLDGFVGAWAFFVEPTRLEVSTVRVESAEVGAPFTIAVVADFQTDRIGAYETRVMATIADAEPDLILFAGDYIQADAATHREVDPRFNALLQAAELDAPLGMYAVMGNIDVGTDWEALFDGTLVATTSQTRTWDAGTLHVTTLSLADSFDRRLFVEDTDDFHVVVGHGPDFAQGDVRADLLVAGHTHGGQVRVPFFGPLLTFSSVPRDWAAGRTDLPGGRTLVVSRGIGMERASAPRMRLFCRPEIVLIQVIPAP